MRIASIHFPSFPLQAAIQSGPARRLLAAAPVAVLHATSPVVTACSRTAWAQGVRPGMIAAVARGHAPGLVTRVREPAREAELLRAVADRLLALSPRVDLGGPVTGLHHAMFVEVPAGKRGAAFGARLVEACQELGLHVRIGIADDRFTAAVAASVGADAEGAVTAVPRGGSAAFLAPLSLGLLSLPPEVQHMLESLGVATLGAFAELPPPSVARAWDADLQALARGDGGARLDVYQPAPRFLEAVEVEASVGAAVQELANRLAARLLGRHGAAVDLALQIGDAPAIHLAVAGDVTGDDLGDRIARAIGDATPARLGAEVTMLDDLTGEPAAGTTPELHEPPAPLVLTPVPSLFGDRPMHRRTRRGKHRPRIAHGQARLFSTDS